MNFASTLARFQPIGSLFSGLLLAAFVTAFVLGLDEGYDEQTVYESDHEAAEAEREAATQMTTRRELWRLYEQFLREFIPIEELDEIDDSGIEWGTVGSDIEYVQTNMAGVLHSLATQGRTESRKFLEREYRDGTLFAHWDSSYSEPGYVIRKGRSMIDLANRPELLEPLLLIEEARRACLSFIRARKSSRG